MTHIKLKPETAGAIEWNARGSCGEPGCTDPLCGCSLCRQPIGKSEEELERLGHDPEYCGGCELCEDQVPIILWRDGEKTLQAQFHLKCFMKVARFVSSCPSPSA